MTQPDSAATEGLHELIPFARHLGIEVLGAGRQEVRLRMAHAPHLCTAGGILHGGAVMALADTAGAMCAVQNMPDGAGTATVESKTNFLRAGKPGYATAVATPLHVGKRFVVVETVVTGEDGKLIGKVTQTQAVLEKSAVSR